MWGQQTKPGIQQRPVRWFTFAAIRCFCTVTACHMVMAETSRRSLRRVTCMLRVLVTDGGSEQTIGEVLAVQAGRTEAARQATSLEWGNRLTRASTKVRRGQHFTLAGSQQRFGIVVPLSVTAGPRTW
jgi:hypothetical protein